MENDGNGARMAGMAGMAMRRMAMEGYGDGGGWRWRGMEMEGEVAMEGMAMAMAMGKYWRATIIILYSQRSWERVWKEFDSMKEISFSCNDLSNTVIMQRQGDGDGNYDIQLSVWSSMAI